MSPTYITNNNMKQIGVRKLFVDLSIKFPEVQPTIIIKSQRFETKKLR